MVSAELAQHTRMKNANVTGCGRFDVTGWDLTRSDLRMSATKWSSHFRLTQAITE